jgi:hypothetical protein
MLVYRIEAPDGSGIYRGSMSCSNPVTDFSESRHPLPHSDSGLVNNINAKRADDEDDDPGWSQSSWIENNDYIFGFANTEQLRNWVFKDEWLQQFQQRGFRLTVFDIDSNDVLVGHTQAIFQRAKAKQESYFEVADFFEIEMD